jgi:hypothetical protein
MDMTMAGVTSIHGCHSDHDEPIQENQNHAKPPRTENLEPRQRNVRNTNSRLSHRKTHKLVHSLDNAPRQARSILQSRKRLALFHVSESPNYLV